MLGGVLTALASAVLASPGAAPDGVAPSHDPASVDRAVGPAPKSPPGGRHSLGLQIGVGSGAIDPPPDPESGGRVAFDGEITALQEEEALGFYFTTASIAGRRGFAGHTATLVIKNETMFLAVDDRPRAYFPDLVLMLEPSTGRGWMSVELRVGSPLSLVLVPCHPRLRRAVQSGTADEAFSPARYGRPQDRYRPLEALGNGS